MPITLLADHNLRRIAVLSFRDRGHDIVTSREWGLDRATDGHLLLSAATARRTLLTSNIDDVVLLHDAWLRWSAVWNVVTEHAGIVVFPQREPWDAARIVSEVELVIGPAGAAPPAGPLANQLWQWRPRDGWSRAAPR